LDSLNRKAILRQPATIIVRRLTQRNSGEPDPIDEKTFGHFALLASDFWQPAGPGSISRRTDFRFPSQAGGGAGHHGFNAEPHCVGSGEGDGCQGKT
jgi:hypothetical protein